MWTIVDDEDYEFLMQWRWRVIQGRKGGPCYAARRDPRTNHEVIMAREIMGLKYGDPRIVDHIDSISTLNNSKKNLRIATQLQNTRNRSRNSNNTSGLKGVSWNRNAHKWVAQIKVDGNQIYLGIFTDKEEAHKAYREAAIEHFGEFAHF